MKTAFSSVACPAWTLDRIAATAGRIGALGVELRTFGDGSATSAGDPFLTAPAKTAALFDDAGVLVASLATSVRFDAPIEPPIIGRVLMDQDRDIRAAKSAVHLAHEIGAPLVRVFGFELHGSENRPRAIRRIAERLHLAADACRNTRVRLCLENGGSFSTAAELLELIDAADHPLLTAAYSIPVGIAAGDAPEQALNALSDKLSCVKLKSLRDAAPAVLGTGDDRFDAPQRHALAYLARAGFDGWCVYEFDHAWLANAPADVEQVLARSIATLYDWTKGAADQHHHGRRHHAHAR